MTSMGETSSQFSILKSISPNLSVHQAINSDNYEYAISLILLASPLLAQNVGMAAPGTTVNGTVRQTEETGLKHVQTNLNFT